MSPGSVTGVTVRVMSVLLMDRFVRIGYIENMRMRDEFSQTDIDAHAAWAILTRDYPMAAALLHLLVVFANKQNAVVVSQAVLAKELGRSKRSIIRALNVLIEGRWIEKRQIGAMGAVNAYVLNARVCWKDARSHRGLAALTAQVWLDQEEQPDKEELGSQKPLRRVERKHFGSVLPFVPKSGDQLDLDLPDEDV